ALLEVASALDDKGFAVFGAVLVSGADQFHGGHQAAAGVLLEDLDLEHWQIGKLHGRIDKGSGRRPDGSGHATFRRGRRTAPLAPTLLVGLRSGFRRPLLLPTDPITGRELGQVGTRIGCPGWSAFSGRSRSRLARVPAHDITAIASLPPSRNGFQSPLCSL